MFTLFNLYFKLTSSIITYSLFQYSETENKRLRNAFNEIKHEMKKQKEEDTNTIHENIMEINKINGQYEEGNAEQERLNLKIKDIQE